MTDSIKVVLNNQINIGADRKKLLFVSGTQKTYQNPNNNGSILGGQILFSNVALPSLANSVISRNMRIRYRVTVQSTAGSAIFMQDPNAALDTYNDPVVTVLRDFPLSRCTDSCILTINNVPTSINLRQTLPAILKTVPKWYLEKQASECPSMADNFPLLPTDAIINVGGTAPAGAYVSSQVLSNNLNSHHATSRASFMPVSVSAGSDQYVWEVCEPVFCPPLTLYDSDTFLADVNSLSLQYNYSLLNDMVVNGCNLTQTPRVYPPGFNVTLVDNSARLELEVISLDSRIVAVPRLVTYPYAMPQAFSTPFISSFGGAGAPISSGAVQNAVGQQSQSLRLSYMPSLIYIYASLPVNVRAAAAVAGESSYADCNLALGTASGAAGSLIYNTDQTGVISISLNNRQGLLQGASIKDLYRISVRSGYQYSYNEWLMNPVVIINPVETIGLDLSQSDIYPDQVGNVTLQVQASFNNWNYIAATTQFAGTGAAQDWATLSPFQMTVVCVQSGVAEISPDTLVVNTGPISAMEVKEALTKSSIGEEDQYLPHTATKAQVEGSGFSDLMGNARNVISSVAKGIGAVASDPLFQAALKKAQGLKGSALTAGRMHKY